MLPPPMSTVSVIITSYNYARFLPQAIDSALAQTHQEVEVLVVDDGSTDDSWAVIESYGSRLVALQQCNAGQISAANRGFAASQGDFVLFLDADDYLLPNAVEALLAPFRTQPELTRSQGFLQLADGSDQRLAGRRPAHMPQSGAHGQRVLAGGPSALSYSSTSGNLWSRVFLQQVMPMKERPMPIGIDSCLNPIANVLGPTAGVETEVAVYRIHGDNCGPVSTEFTLGSLRRRLALLEGTEAVLAEQLARLGIAAPNRSRWRAHWFSWLLRYAIDLLEAKDARSRWALLRPGCHFGEARPERMLSLRARMALAALLPAAQQQNVIRGLLNFGQPAPEGDPQGARLTP